MTGAAPSAPGALLVSLPNQPNVTLFPAANPGVVVSGAGLLAAAPILAHADGTLSIELSGIATPVDLVLQSLLFDAAVLPHNVAFSNAVLAAFGK